MNCVKVSILALWLTIGYAAAVMAGSGFAWRAVDITLAQLIQDQYMVVSAQFHASTNKQLTNYREVVYLKKKTELYRCFTTVRSKNHLLHECHIAHQETD